MGRTLFDDIVEPEEALGLPAAVDTLLRRAAASCHSSPPEAIVLERARKRFVALGDAETKRIEPYTHARRDAITISGIIERACKRLAILGYTERPDRLQYMAGQVGLYRDDTYKY